VHFPQEVTPEGGMRAVGFTPQMDGTKQAITGDSLCLLLKPTLNYTAFMSY